MIDNSNQSNPLPTEQYTYFDPDSENYKKQSSHTRNHTTGHNSSYDNPLRIILDELNKEIISPNIISDLADLSDLSKYNMIKETLHKI